MANAVITWLVCTIGGLILGYIFWKSLVDEKEGE